MLLRVCRIIDILVAGLIGTLIFISFIIFLPVFRFIRFLTYDTRTRKPRMFTTFNMSYAGFVERGMEWRVLDQDLDSFFERAIVFLIIADVQNTIIAKDGGLIIIDNKHLFKDVVWLKENFRFLYILLSFIYETMLISLLVWKHSIDFSRVRGPFYEGLLGLAQKCLNGIPYIISVHADWDRMYKETGQGVLCRYKFIDEIVERINLFFADSVISFFPAQESYLLRHRARKNRIRLSYVPTRFYELFSKIDKSPQQLKEELHLPLDKRILMYAGRFSVEKYVDDLIRVLYEIRKSIIDSVLVLIGRGPAEFELQRLCTDLGFSEQDVIFIPYQNHSNLAKYYLCADVHLAPDGGSSMREALFSGKPVVGYNIWTVTEFIEDGKNGLIVEFRNIQKLAEAVISLLNNPELSHSIAENAVKDAYSLYSAPKVYAHRKKIYGELLKNRYPNLEISYEES
ncbi:MAG: glycosyltransferase family 4 protein [Candidatus Hydrogenedentota bacterium]